MMDGEQTKTASLVRLRLWRPARTKAGGVYRNILRIRDPDSRPSSILTLGKSGG